MKTFAILGAAAALCFAPAVAQSGSVSVLPSSSSATPSGTPTPTVTPIVTPSVTPSASVTPSSTASPSISWPTPSPSSGGAFPFKRVHARQMRPLDA